MSGSFTSESPRRRLPGAGLVRRRERAELEDLRQAARQWSEKLERVRLAPAETESSHENGEPEYEEHLRQWERLERLLAEKEAELRALRGAAAGRELDLQREHSAESRRQREEIASLKKRLAEAETSSGAAREEELREVKRLAYERESELRRTSAQKLSETEKDAERRISALREQREADNRSLVERHAREKARREEELQSLRLRRLSEGRVYESRIEELARERAEERTSLEEAVAKLREKHEAERARLRERIESLEEALDEQESITVGLLGELGYLHGQDHTSQNPELSGRWRPAGELEAAHQPDSQNGIRESLWEALRELRQAATPGDLIRDGLAAFNESEHARVMGAVCKSLGEPSVYAALEEQHGGGTTAITLLWTGAAWRRYVVEPRAEGGRMCTSPRTAKTTTIPRPRSPVPTPGSTREDYWPSVSVPSEESPIVVPRPVASRSNFARSRASLLRATRTLWA